MGTPVIVHSIAQLRERVAAARGAGHRVALVPTMGALHDGHLALVDRAAELAETVIVSIFVNPLQFAPGEDFERYPRTLETDAAALATRSVDAVFAPSVAEMYPHGDSSTRVTAGQVGELFDGASRPGHFDGMLTVVAKLFNIVQPDVALFGEKDAQQLHLVRTMVAELDMPLRIEAVPTVRESGGLARSSRNQFLDGGHRDAALALSKALAAAAAAGAGGVGAAREAGRGVLLAEPLVVLDYFELVDPETFLPLAEGASGPARAIVAAKLGSTRLIDNASLTLG